MDKRQYQDRFQAPEMLMANCFREIIVEIAILWYETWKGYINTHTQN